MNPNFWSSCLYYQGARIAGGTTRPGYLFAELGWTQASCMLVQDSTFHPASPAPGSWWRNAHINLPMGWMWYIFSLTRVVWPQSDTWACGCSSLPLLAHKARRRATGILGVLDLCSTTSAAYELWNRTCLSLTFLLQHHLLWKQHRERELEGRGQQTQPSSSRVAVCAHTTEMQKL